jgi:hypothetical protein
VEAWFPTSNRQETGIRILLAMQRSVETEETLPDLWFTSRLVDEPIHWGSFLKRQAIGIGEWYGIGIP